MRAKTIDGRVAIINDERDGFGNAHQTERTLSLDAAVKQVEDPRPASETLKDWLGIQIESCKADFAMYRDDPAFKGSRDGALIAISAKIAAYQAVLSEIDKDSDVGLSELGQLVFFHKKIAKNNLKTAGRCLTPATGTKGRQRDCDVVMCWLRSFDATLDLVEHKVRRVITQASPSAGRRLPFLE